MVLLLLIALTALSFQLGSCQRAISPRPLAPTGDNGAGKIWLLIIAIDKYMYFNPLGSCVHDAKAVRDMLKQRYVIDYVIELYDEQATGKGIIDAFTNLKSSVARDDCLIIYYSGHGVFDNNLNAGFWIPVDGKPGNPLTWVANDVIKRFIAGLTEVKHVLLICDSCFSGDFFRGGAAAPPKIDSEYYARVWEKPSRKAMTSGAMEPVADTALGGHSPFAYFLLKALGNNAKPYLTPSTLFEWVKEGVLINSPFKQQPLYGDIGYSGGLPEGEFIFFLRQSAPLPTTGLLEVSSEPSGAEVFVDGKPQGRTPCGVAIELGIAQQLAVMVKLKHPGYYDKEAPVMLRPGEIARCQVKLEPLPPERKPKPEPPDVLPGGGRIFRGPEPPAQAEPGDIWINPKDGAELCFVPAGEFIMGSNDGLDNERPQHRVYLDGYWIYKYEVTVAQYRKFCQATGRKMPLPPEWGWKDDHPIVYVTWDDAVAYAKWAGVRLPTEAEWEKAARGTDGREYPWGNKWDASKCNNYWTGPKQTTAVGSYPQGVSPYGVHDMAGNVWEWCADWYDPNYYRSAPSKNPLGPSSGMYRVVRGSSWIYENPDRFRCALRDFYNPEVRFGNYGFRCARGL